MERYLRIRKTSSFTPNVNPIYNTYDDWGLVLTSLEVGASKVRTHYVEIPGRNGQMDLTDYLKRYEEREIEITFEKIIGCAEMFPFFIDLEGIVQGNEFDIVISDLAAKKFIGRIELEYKQKSNNIMEVKMKVFCASPSMVTSDLGD